jgi:hypothetical protein
MSTITYEQKFRQQEAARNAAELDRKNRAVFGHILNKYYIREHEANYQMFLKFAGTLLTMDAADYLMKNRPEGFQIDMTTRQALIEELVELLRDPTERRMTTHDLHTKTVQLAGKTLAELRAYRRSLTFKQEHATAESARDYLRTQRGYARPKYVGYEDMPLTLTIPGEAVARSAKDALQWYAKNDFWTFKNRLVPRYGMQQITDVLNQQ